MIREMVRLITQEAFQGEPPIILGTGGFIHMFEKENLFTAILPDLVLEGIRLGLTES